MPNRPGRRSQERAEQERRDAERRDAERRAREKLRRALGASRFTGPIRSGRQAL